MLCHQLHVLHHLSGLLEREGVDALEHEIPLRAVRLGVAQVIGVVDVPGLDQLAVEQLAGKLKMIDDALERVVDVHG